ncbi:hypothetical protein Tco_0639473 [Tanacetum coccineum]
MWCYGGGGTAAVEMVRLRWWWWRRGGDGGEVVLIVGDGVGTGGVARGVRVEVVESGRSDTGDLRFYKFLGGVACGSRNLAGKMAAAEVRVKETEDKIFLGELGGVGIVVCVSGNGYSQKDKNKAKTDKTKHRNEKSVENRS